MVENDDDTNNADHDIIQIKRDLRKIKMKITKKQAEAIAEIFEFTGETFQKVAEKAGLKNIPNHLDDISHDDARKIMKMYNIKISE